NISTWLRDIRMTEAARLLSDTKRPIAEISEQVGDSNQGKFAAVFKKQFGLSPLEYRRSKNLENR
ncbi:helix-turn-helix transcriptional regulator, partial [Blautia schinkii]|uniref:helix-turn-helix transcriptional regulator n=1 Tax=Blautia schinkii TaxID=180164 RepID=UPI0023AE912A